MLAKAPVLVVLALIFCAAPSWAGPGKVTCKAKLFQSDRGTIAIEDLVPTSQTDSEIIREARIQDVGFELRESKLVFFFRPVIHLPGNREVTTTGYFAADDTIKVQYSSLLENGVRRIADIRCCRDCTFSDWPSAQY